MNFGCEHISSDKPDSFSANSIVLSPNKSPKISSSVETYVLFILIQEAAQE